MIIYSSTVAVKQWMSELIDKTSYEIVSSKIMDERAAIKRKKKI